MVFVLTLRDVIGLTILALIIIGFLVAFARAAYKDRRAARKRKHDDE